MFYKYINYLFYDLFILLCAVLDEKCIVWIKHRGLWTTTFVRTILCNIPYYPVSHCFTVYKPSIIMNYVRSVEQDILFGFIACQKILNMSLLQWENLIPNCFCLFEALCNVLYFVWSVLDLY